MPRPTDPLPASPQALFRYQVISSVLADLALGWGRADAVREAASTDWYDATGTLRRVSPRTVYRWLAAWDSEGFASLEPKARARTDSSQVLSQAFLDFLTDQKGLDPAASIPELIRRARLLEIVDPDEALDRTTAWRAARRMGLTVQRCATPRTTDVRPFRYLHRMQMLMCDGKHFRAGEQRHKRVALFYLDNATRYGLNAVVGTSENTRLALRGLYESTAEHGFFDITYLDQGAAFAARATAEVVRRLNAILVHGRARYAPGRGTIERFNQTALNQVLRNLDRRPDVDPDCGALELRLKHFVREVYNHTPHEGLDGDTPAQRWYADSRPLRMADSDRDLRDAFVIGLDRKVTNDNTISVEGTDYEVPRGHAGTRVDVYERFLDDDGLFVVHEGRWVRIHPVDLQANAVSGRARRSDAPETTGPLPPTSAELAYAKAFGPIVGPDGGFSDPTEE